MAKIGRPQKKGLDYFSFITTFFSDFNTRKIARYCQGGNGIVVYIYFITKIYENGYYLELNDEWYTWPSLDLVYTEEFIIQCVEYMTKAGMFDRDLYENHKILTSQDIQKQYFYICQQNKRKKPSVPLPYLLIELPEEEADMVQSESDFVPEEIDDCEQVTKKIFISGENTFAQSDISLNDKINLLAFQEFFNSEIEKNQSRIHKITQITPARSKLLEDRVKEHGKEALAKVVMKATRSPFLNGATEHPFVPNFEWLFKPDNYVKVLEGCYDKPSKNPTQKLSDAQRWTKCLQDLCNAVSDNDSRQIFSHLSFLKFDADTSELLLQVPRKEVYDYVEQHLVKIMNRILPKYFGSKVQLKYLLPKN